ncbi:hypothetical protein KCM76_19405 [Zooshikella marina]|uniref:hypothetical protein n=1 Tax=Zooshikella ganghwensis TaxID=202772 RepID=UPI001BB01EF7|nr:hypothetical protein [Zooshikella ganghwensis]MBU2708168.1 hypothetical protein [Zooshikella ganghwensis]
MAKTFERKTVVVDCKKERYFMLPNYIYDFQIDWPNILPKKENAEGYLFIGDEKWIEY